jgi:hypothetical protein
MLQGLTGGVLGPGVVAITLGLVGHAKLAERLGQNQRFAAAGGIVVTVTMAVIAYADSPWAMFVPVALALPVLVALYRIRREEIDFGRASGGESRRGDHPQRSGRHGALLQNRRLLIFAACVALFHFANASMLPLASGMLAHEGKRQAAPLIAALIVVPQLIVVLLAPWVGQRAEQQGRKPLLLVGFAALPIRAMLFALTSNPLALMAVQVLDGITGAVLGVMTALVIADVTKGTGRFNLAQGLLGTMMGVGASLSPGAFGVDRRSFRADGRVCQPRRRGACRTRHRCDLPAGDKVAVARTARLRRPSPFFAATHRLFAAHPRQSGSAPSSPASPPLSPGSPAPVCSARSLCAASEHRSTGRRTRPLRLARVLLALGLVFRPMPLARKRCDFFAQGGCR